MSPFLMSCCLRRKSFCEPQDLMAAEFDFRRYLQHQLA